MRKMIILQACLLLLLSQGVNAQTADKVQFLDIGTKMPDYPKVDWLKGEPVTKFDDGKIYIVELWATWCVPCIAAMPHLNQLNNKFKTKNVVFVAQDVMEDNKEKVVKFVEQKGDGLNFAVAYSGATGSDFDRKWVKAAGINAIPATFIIQHGKLVWQTSPEMLNDEIIQLLIDDKFSIEAAEAIIKKQH